MTLDETLERSRELDRLLAVGGSQMPETGARKLAGEFGGMLADLKKAVDEVKLEVAASVAELVGEVNSGREVARSLRAEAAEVRKAFGEVLGNAPPPEGAPKPPAAT